MIIWTVSKLLEPFNYLLTVYIIIVVHGSLEHFCTILLISNLKQSKVFYSMEFSVVNRQKRIIIKECSLSIQRLLYDDGFIWRPTRIDIGMAILACILYATPVGEFLHKLNIRKYWLQIIRHFFSWKYYIISVPVSNCFISSVIKDVYITHELYIIREFPLTCSKL
jgi:hypothetical protein